MLKTIRALEPKYGNTCHLKLHQIKLDLEVLGEGGRGERQNIASDAELRKKTEKNAEYAE